MTGIAAMFAELSAPDPFDVQVALERVAHRRSEYDSERYRRTMADPELREKHRARKRAWWREYAKRRSTDPGFVEMRRAISRRSMAKARARGRA